MTMGAPRHTWLCLTGGAIGQGMPAAVGAAIACPDRKVVNLQADGSAMYTLQALWTQAREQLDVTTVIFSNRAYAILNMELGRVGATPPGPRALSMLDLSRPTLDFVALARGMGVNAARATSADEFNRLFQNAMNERGPHPWELSFSYGRALQAPALKAWRGDEAHVAAGQEAYAHRSKMNGLARSGEYSAEREKELATA